MTDIEKLKTNILLHKQWWRDCIARGEIGQAELLLSRIGELMARLFVMEEQNGQTNRD